MNNASQCGSFHSDVPFIGAAGLSTAALTISVDAVSHGPRCHDECMVNKKLRTRGEWFPFIDTLRFNKSDTFALVTLRIGIIGANLDAVPLTVDVPTNVVSPEGIVESAARD